jgi:hypothetical protein
VLKILLPSCFWILHKICLDILMDDHH